MRRLAALALPLLIAAGFAAAAEARPFTARDLVMLDRVSDPRVSPDGRHVAYTLRSTDWEANRGRQALWVADLRPGGAAPRRLAASEGGANSQRWASDGRLYFLSSRAGGRSQVWRTDAQGRTAVQVTDLPLDVGSFRVSPDGRTLAVSMAVLPECPTLACTVERQAADAGDGRSGALYDRTFVRHWDAWADGTRNHLYLVDLGGRAPATTARPLMAGFDGDSPTRPFGDDADYGFSPDGRAIVFSAKVAGRDEPWTTNFDLWRVSTAPGGGAPENLTPGNRAWDAGPVFSPDGRYMAYRAMRRPGFEADRWAIMVRDVASGATREIAAGWDRSADTLQWSADGASLYATAQDVGQTRVFRIALTDGRVEPLTPDGHAAAFDVSGTDLIYAYDTLTAPAQLYARSGSGEPRRLTDHNVERLADVDFGQPEQFRFRGWNGETVHGYVVRPAGYRPGQRYPVAFLIHGGPQGSFGNLFHYRWNAQTYAARGYAVVMIDFHGSTGYGQGFTDAISGHWGDRPLEDLQRGWTAAQRQYPWLDGSRACALGGSYGGFMVNWIAGRWSEPWDCLVNHSGIFDTRQMGYSTEELWFTEWEAGGATPYQDAAAYERFNPVRHVENWRTPTLVIHGALDYRVPIEQGLASFNALQRRGVPSQFLHFPDENHWILKPQNSVQWHETVEAWLDRWTREGAETPRQR